MKKLLSIMALFVISLLAVSMVAATVSEDSTLGSLTANDITVEVNDEETSGLLVVEEGEELEVEVKLVNNGNPAFLTDLIDNDGDGIVDEVDENEVEAENIEVEARLMGYDEEDTKDSKIVSVKVGTARRVDLNVVVPKDFKNGPDAVLRIFVYGNGQESVLTADYKFYVESPSHAVDVVDVDFSPGSTVKAGRSLLTTVLVENTGEKDQDDVKVTVAIPELGVSASEFIDDLDTTDSNGHDYDDDNTESVELFLQIPATAEEGDYEVEVTVKYDDLKKSVTHTKTLTVLANQDFANQEKLTVLQVGPESQTAGAGKTATYAVALTNAGSTSRAYTVEAVAGDWAEVSVSEKMVVLEPGKNQVVYVDVAVANDAAAGEHLVSVTVKSGSEALETVVLKANVVESNSQTDSISLRNGLEIALVVLVVLLVVLGLIIGFSRLKKDDEEEQTYY